MSWSNTRPWRSLGSWNGTAFLVAGASLLVTTAINAIDLLTPIATQEGALLWLEGATGFGGVVLFFIGLLGLYFRVSDAAPRQARAGMLLATGPALFFSVLLVTCSVLAPLLGFPSLKTIVPSFALIAETVLLSFALALTLLGVACLRTSVPSRTVGGLLFVIAAVWYGFFGAMLLARYHIPMWVTFLQTALMAVSMVAIGVRLWMATRPINSEESLVEPTV